MEIDNIKIVSQILYSKYNKIFHWLSYADVYRLVTKITEKFKGIIFESNLSDRIDVHKIKIIHKKLFPYLEMVDETKTLRKYSETSEISVNDNHKNQIKSATNQTEKSFFGETNVPMIEKLSYKVYTVFVDSYDRNKSLWKELNPFSFPMGYENSMINAHEKMDKSSEKYGGSISKTFSNVEYINIVKIIIPSVDQDGNSLFLKNSYILFKIDEIENKTNGTNKEITLSFGRLCAPLVNENNFIFLFNDNQLSHTFEPRVEISKLTFHFKYPNGNTILFASDDDANDLRIGIELNIKSLHKSMTTQYLNR
jgi:hypothetical protein